MQTETTETQAGRYATDAAYFARRLEIRELGVKFQRFFSQDCVQLVATVVSVPKPGTGTRKYASVYDVTIARDAGCGWRAVARCNARTIFTMDAFSKCALEKLAMAALKDWIFHKFRRTRLNREEREAREMQGRFPLAPDEELADTVERMNEN